MKRTLLLMGLGFAAASPAMAQETPPQEAEHIVRPGDTLWDLARRYFENPYLWTQIFGANRDVIADPNRIYPAERLRIPGLVVQPVPVAPDEAAADDRTVFFPTGELAGPGILAADRALLPAIRPGDFYRAGILVGDDEIAPVGEVAEVVSPSVVPLETQRAIQLNDRVFTRMVAGAPDPLGTRYQLIRRERMVPGYGTIFLSTGIATLIARDGDVGTMQIDEMHDDIRPGDLVVPSLSFPVVVGDIPRPASGLEGRILAFQSPHAVQSVEDLAFVDLGAASGVKEGDEFIVVQPSQRAAWGTRPEITIARLQVVRVSRRTAAMRVVGMDQPALVPGLPVRLIARMP